MIHKHVQAVNMSLFHTEFYSDWNLSSIEICRQRKARHTSLAWWGTHPGLWLEWQGTSSCVTLQASVISQALPRWIGAGQMDYMTLQASVISPALPCWIGAGQMDCVTLQASLVSPAPYVDRQNKSIGRSILIAWHFKPQLISPAL